MKFHLYFFHVTCTHWTEHCREPGHKNSAGFSLKVSCVPNWWTIVSEMQDLCHGLTNLLWEVSFSCSVTKAPWLCSIHPCFATWVADKAHSTRRSGAGISWQGSWPKYGETRPVSGVQSPPGIHPFLKERYLCQTGWADLSPVSFLFLFLPFFLYLQPKKDDSHTQPLGIRLGGFLEAYIHLSNLIESIQPKENENGGSWGKIKQLPSSSTNKLHLCPKTLPVHFITTYIFIWIENLSLTCSINSFRSLYSCRTSKVWFCFVVCVQNCEGCFQYKMQ